MRLHLPPEVMGEVRYKVGWVPSVPPDVLVHKQRSQCVLYWRSVLDLLGT